MPKANNCDVNDTNTRTYATEAALVKGLTNFGLEEFTYIVVWNAAGRCTAIFNRIAHEAHGNLTVAASRGFLTLG